MYTCIFHKSLKSLYIDVVQVHVVYEIFIAKEDYTVIS